MMPLQLSENKRVMVLLLEVGGQIVSDEIPESFLSSLNRPVSSVFSGQ
jgi:hypothetical protein